MLSASAFSFSFFFLDLNRDDTLLVNDLRAEGSPGMLVNRRPLAAAPHSSAHKQCEGWNASNYNYRARPLLRTPLLGPSEWWRDADRRVGAHRLLVVAYAPTASSPHSTTCRCNRCQNHRRLMALAHAPASSSPGPTACRCNRCQNHWRLMALAHAPAASSPHPTTCRCERRQDHWRRAGSSLRVQKRARRERQQLDCRQGGAGDRGHS